jgi:bacteriocin leader peptide (microcyclamide/patellamide family)
MISICNYRYHWLWEVEDEEQDFAWEELEISLKLKVNLPEIILIDPPTEPASTKGQIKTITWSKTLMNHKNLIPQSAQPVNRITTGQLPAQLAELSEEALFQLGTDACYGNASVLASSFGPPPFVSDWERPQVLCSYGGDDAE